MIFRNHIVEVNKVYWLFGSEFLKAVIKVFPFFEVLLKTVCIFCATEAQSERDEVFFVKMSNFYKLILNFG